MRSYRYAELTGEESRRWSQPRFDPSPAIRFVRDSFGRDERIRWRLRGKPWSGWRTRAAVVDRLQALLPDAKVGDMFVVENKVGHRVGIRAVDFAPLAETPGTKAVDVAHAVLLSNFEGLESWGICNCRYVAGTRTWSQHAYCNAEDWHAPVRVMARVARFLADHASDLQVAHVIYDGRIWSPASGWTAYRGTNPHVDHVHVDFLPNRTGTPPCAR